MDTEDVEALRGRIEAVAQFAVALAAELHHACVIDVTQVLTPLAQRALRLQMESPVAQQEARAALVDLLHSLAATLQLRDDQWQMPGVPLPEKRP
ncbi:hypothetical protein [Leptothrix cholodnii]|uniref:hypothetical protein n=1 Tax=Leptothrix cholodnii TaxID=34029 RepID=UPI0005BC861E|nr:hypothetical protein [Leptothrix cholodnii]